MDAKSRAAFGELLLVKSQEMIERHEFSKARAELEKYRLNSTTNSTLEVAVEKRIKIFKGRLLRYEGQFSKAEKQMEPLLGMRDNGITSGLGPNLVAIKCEWVK